MDVDLKMTIAPVNNTNNTLLMSNMANADICHIYATVMIKNGLWRVIFERNSNGEHTVAQHIFGKEPSDAEVYQFILNNYYLLKFSEPRNFKVIIKRQSPKRVLREVKKLLNGIQKSNKSSTYAEDVIKQQLEINKKERKVLSLQQKQDMVIKKFAMKQEKRNIKADNK